MLENVKKLSTKNDSRPEEGGFNFAGYEQAKTGGTGARGAISLPGRIFAGPGKPGSGEGVKITLTPRADVTTAIHELGHLFLWISDKQAARFTENEQLQNDMRIIREFVGWEEGQTAFSKEQHEKFADAYLEYLKEGKAPSTALRQAFRRFTQWLTDFYRAVKGSPGVELSDEMRGVFDRMLATEEQIEAAIAENEFADVFDKFDSPGEQAKTNTWGERVARAKESLLSRLMKEISPENEEKIEILRASTEKVVREQVKKMPIYRAMEKLRASPESAISDESILDEYGETAFDGLPDGVHSREGKFSADDAAASFGYGSGDELLLKLKEAPDIEDEIKARVDEQMRRASRSAMDSGEIADMADEELRNGEALEIMASEREKLVELRMKTDESTPEEWDEMIAADEIASAEQENPKSRPNVIRWIVDNGGINYNSVKDRFSKDALSDLRGRGLPVGFWKKDAQGIDEMAQEMSYNGIPIENGDELFDILMGDDPPESPLTVAFREGYSAAREYARKVNERKREREKARKAEREAKKEAKAEERLEKKIVDEYERQERKRETAAISDRAKAEAQAVLDAARSYIGTQNVYAVKKMAKLKAYIAAEKSARKELKEALRGRKWELADEASRRQMLNHALSIALREANKELEKDWRYMDTIRNRLSAKSRSEIEKSRMEQITALFERFSYRPATKESASIKSLGTFLLEQARQGYTNNISAEIENGSLQKPWYRLSESQHHDLADAVRWLEHNGREATRLSKEFGRRDLAKTCRDLSRSINAKFAVDRDSDALIKMFESNRELAMSDTILNAKYGDGILSRIPAEAHSWKSQTNPDTAAEFLGYKSADDLIEALKRAKAETEEKERKRKPNIRDSGKIYGIKNFLKMSASSLLKIEFITRALDGFEDMGTVWRTIFKPIVNGENKENRMNREYTEKFRNIISAHFTRKEWKALRSPFKKIWIASVKRNFTREQLISIGFNAGNSINKERVMTGENWTDQQFNDVLTYITENEWRFIQDTWNLINELWSEVEALERDITGMPPKKVEAAAFRVRPKDWSPDKLEGLRLDGGYYPIAYDGDETRFIREQTERQTMQDLFESQWAHATTWSGHTKQRVRSTGFKLDYDLGVIPRHLTNVIHDLSFRKAVIDVDKIVRDKDVMTSIISVLGDKVYDELRPWLQNIARQEYQQPDPVSRVLRFARKSSQVVMLGWKFSVSLAQGFGFFPVMYKVGKRRTARHILSFYSNPFAWREKAKMVYEKSEMMRNRAQSRDRDIRAIVKEIESKGKLGDLQEVFFWTVSTADLAVTLPSWIAAYEKGMENFGMDEAKAIDYADMIIRNTQDAGSPKDLSRIQRGGELMKLFTMFYNSLNTAFNMMAEEVLRAKLGKGSKKQIAAAFFWLVFLPAVAGELVFGDDEDDEDSDGTWNTIARYAKAVAQYPLTTIPLLRDVVSSYQYRTTPAQAMFEEGRRAFKAVGFAVDAFKSGDGDKEREALRRLTTGSLMVAGYAFKFPAGQLRITLNALFDAFDDDYDVEPLDFFLYRKRKKVKK